MIIRSLFTALLAVNIAVLTPSLACAATPKFLIKPVGNTRFNITNDETLGIEYSVQNQTKLTRTLTMVPLQGLTQVTTGVNACANPFTLSPNQSCVLTLQANPTNNAFHILGGPEICKTKSGTNTPDPFLCSQPAAADQLSIFRRKSSFVRGLSASPTQLSIPINSFGQITVTNNSFFITATNVQADFGPSALATNVTQNSSNCTSLAPLQSCVLTFTTNGNAISLTSFAITSDTARPIGAALEVTSLTAASLNIEGSPLVYLVGSSTPAERTLTITNTTPTLNAGNIRAYNTNGTELNNSSSPLSATYTNCDALTTATCTITFNSTGPVTLTTIFVYGTTGGNSSISTAEIAANDATQATLSIIAGNPMTLTAAGSDSTIQTMTILNTSNSVTATNITVPVFPSPLAGAVQLVSTTCQSVAPGASCQLGFQANTTQADTTNFAIQGSNTQAVVGTITVNPVNYAYTAGDATTSIYRCNLATSNGMVSGCSAVADGQQNIIGLILNASNSQLYVLNYGNNTLSNCAVTQVTGGLSCVNNIPTSLTGNLQGLTINPSNTLLYVAANRGLINQCPLTANGTSIGACTSSGSSPVLVEQITMNPAGSILYLISLSNGAYQCPVDSTTGNIGVCTNTGATSLPANARGIILDSNNAYAYIVGQNGVTSCSVNSTNGNLFGCTSYTPPGGVMTFPTDLKINSTNTYIYATNINKSLSQCAVLNGVVSSCINDIEAGTGQSGSNSAIALLQ